MRDRLDALFTAQRELRSRFDDFRQALNRDDRTAVAVALEDFERHLRCWTEAEERALVPAVERARIPGRDARRELRLEYVQIRELTRFLLQQVQEGVRPMHLVGYVENLERRLRAHEKEMAQVYYPAADRQLTETEWHTLAEVWGQVFGSR